MTEALSALALHPELNHDFQTRGTPIGGPAQLLKALSADPAALTRDAPPDEIYAHTVWLSMRVYTAARANALTIAALPGLLTAEAALTPAERGKNVRTVISGLARRATDIGGLCQTLANRLAPFKTGLSTAQAGFGKLTSALETQAQSAREDGQSIYAHAQATTLATAMRSQLAEIEIRGAEVGAYAVLANLATAMGNLAAAWQATVAQFEKAGATGLEQLGDPARLEEALHPEAGAAEWRAFATITQEFLQRALIVR